MRPVLDLRDQLPVDAYEIPLAMREALRLSRPTSVFPFSASGCHTGDVDHTIPYLPVDRGGPPGQTRVDRHGTTPFGLDPPGIETVTPPAPAPLSPLERHLAALIATG